jgi:hypothetical protein
MEAGSIWNDVIVRRWSALEIFKNFTRATTGTPTALALANGCVALGLENTNEAEAHALTSGETFRIADLQYLRIVAACSANVGANSGIQFGLCETRNNAPDSINEGVWFRVMDDNTVRAESDDGTTDVDDKLTNLSLGLTLKQFVFNFRDGMWKRDIRSGGNLGGKAAILLSMDNAAGNLAPVCRSDQFTLNAATGPLQIFAQIVKASSTDTGILYLREIELGINRVSYAAA